MTNMITILHPGIEQPDMAAPKLAARQATLRDKRLALLDNGKLNADTMLLAVTDRLKSLGVGEVRAWRKRHASESGEAVIPELLAWRPDLVLNALGD
jgi:hypothetical protein